MSWFYTHANYVACIVLLMVGLYTLLATQNMLKKLLGLAIFQTAISLFYVSVGKVSGGTAPILISTADSVAYSNPLPHVLILTAIVVGVATLSVGLALLIRIHNAYGTIEEDEVNAKDQKSQ